MHVCMHTYIHTYFDRCIHMISYTCMYNTMMDVHMIRNQHCRLSNESEATRTEGRRCFVIFKPSILLNNVAHLPVVRLADLAMFH